MIVLTGCEEVGVGETDGVEAEVAAAVRAGGSLVPEFPLAARATVVAPTAAARTAPLTQPEIRIPIWGKRDRPTVRIRLDG